MKKNLKKVSQCRKKLKKGPLVSPGIVRQAEQRKTILVQLAGPTGTFQNFVELSVELLWSLQAYRRKNTDETT